ncbi:hypothetical protein DIPPA_10315 [Diplonema papillatum]|nr:hypothetical protein DIPPA_10315 [Diplonema papillatum]
MRNYAQLCAGTTRKYAEQPPVVRKTSVLGREINSSLPGYTLQRRWERMQAAKLHTPPPLPPKAS